MSSEKITPSAPEQQAENVEKIFDSYLEAMLATHRIDNAGNNGLIMRFGLEDVPEDAQAILRERGVPLDWETAVKVLKVYSPTQGRKEYEMLQRAYDLVENAANRDELALIPKPMLYREIPIQKDTREHLNLLGTRLDDKAAILIMEYLPGKDIATHIYDFVLRENNYEPAMLEEMGIDEKQQLVIQLLHFRDPGRKSTDAGEREYERVQVMAENAGRLVKFAGERGMRIHPSVIDKIQRTTRLLHKEGIWHNDLYERNVMAVDMADQDTPVFVIDFGSAGERDESKSSVEMKINDDSLPTRLRAIIKAAEAKTQEHRQLKTDILNMKERLQERGLWDSKYAKVKGLFMAGGHEFLDNQFKVATVSVDELDRLVLFLDELLHDPAVEEEQKKEVAEFVRQHREADSRGYVRKRFSFFDAEQKKDA